MSTRNTTAVSTSAAAFLIGSLAGLTLGVLFAPKSGRESREAIRQKAQDNLSKIQRKMNERTQAGKATMDEGFDNAREAVDTLHDAADEAEQEGTKHLRKRPEL